MPSPEVERLDWFAQREEESYRDEARNILDSYAHPWDILAELAQNAVDAIDVRAAESGSPTNGTIEIEVNAETRTIRFKDNGIGIGEADLRLVLKPHFSRKRGKILRGEKGVGLTYIALTGNKFEILSKTAASTHRLSVHGAQEWVYQNGERPKMEIGIVTHDTDRKNVSYTQVTVTAIPEKAAASDEVDIFSLSFDQLEYLLRTRTAIGWTGVLFGTQLQNSVTVSLTVRTPGQAAVTKLIRFAYATPEERLPLKSVVTLEEVKAHLASTDEKRIYGKAIRYTQIFKNKGGKDIRMYCLLNPRHVYIEQTESLDLPAELHVQGGIYVATKGMPTGIMLQPPRTGSSGYWPNIYMVVEYDNITLDLGRKSITAPRTIQMLSSQAAHVFNEIQKYIKYTMREDEGTLDALTSSNELQNELNEVRAEASVIFEDDRSVKPAPGKYPALRLPKQEQDVVALFVMMLARGALPYELLRVSSSYRYDCFLKYPLLSKPLYIVAEFKLHGEAILSDLVDAKVRYGQLNLLICWKMDEAKLRGNGFVIDAVRGKKNELPGATHKLSFPMSAGIKDQPIAVICLSELMPTS